MTAENEQELRAKLAETREKLRVFRFGMSGSKLKNVKEGRTLRKEIARILTKLSNGSRKSK